MKPTLILMLVATAALAAPAPAAAQSYRDTGYAFCICPSGKRGNVGPGKDYATCEAFCDEGGSSGPAIDYGAIQRAEQERQDRERREREAQAVAERKARAAMEQRKFEADKADAVRSLKGVSSGETRLKGVSAAPNELKGLDGGDGPGLKGLGGAPEKKPAKSCRMEDSCAQALAAQAEALDAARRGQLDLYRAMATADFQHGVGLLKADMKASAEAAGAPIAKVKVWENSDVAGLPLFLRDYKHTVDDVFQLAASKRASALNGDLDPPRESVIRSAPKLVTEQDHRRWDIAKDVAERAKAFHDYVRELSKCGDVPPKDYADCVKRAGLPYEAALRALPVQGATQSRVRIMGGALTKYSLDAMERAMAVAESASRCLEGCR